ncbi:MAG: hypothetical protein LBU16_04235 [Treponema sp.]|jgi:hypothetical protein|nr:hypothetical protein [Treponema sp.]
MKLSPEFPARQILKNAGHSPASGSVHANRSDAAAIGKSPQTSPAFFRDLTLSLGLPRDALSASLLSLAKFFSLPLDTRLMQRLRQQALSLTPPPAKALPGNARDNGPQQPDQPLAGPLRSAVLAAAAAAGKGVALSHEALASYAAALAVDDREGEAPEDEAEARGGADRDGERPPEQPEAAPGFPASKNGPGSALFAERIEERLPLLGVLNRIPGRDGRRWITLPFSFESGGAAFNVSLRIALADTNSIPWKAERMALDVKTDQRRWSFMLENAGSGDGQVFARAVFGVDPPLKAGAERELRKLLGSIAGKVALRDISSGAFPEEETGAAQWDR